MKRRAEIIVPFVAQTLLGLLLSGCSGPCYLKERQPLLPSAKLNGWQDFMRGTIRCKGEFLLNKGESVSNGKVEIKVVDIYPDQCHRISEPTTRKVKIQFINVSDQKVILEESYEVGSHVMLVGDPVIDWDVLYIAGINTKDNWTLLELRGDKVKHPE